MALTATNNNKPRTLICNLTPGLVSTSHTKAIFAPSSIVMVGGSSARILGGGEASAKNKNTY